VVALDVRDTGQGGPGQVAAGLLTGDDVLRVAVGLQGAGGHVDDLDSAAAQAEYGDRPAGTVDARGSGAGSADGVRLGVSGAGSAAALGCPPAGGAPAFGGTALSGGAMFCGGSGALSGAGAFIGTVAGSVLRLPSTATGASA